MVGAYGMDNSFYSYLPFGGSEARMANPELKQRVEIILDQEYRKVKKLLEANKDALIAIAEALILRNELTDIDVDEILTRVEAQHPFVDPGKSDEQPFGFAMRSLPESITSSRRNGRRNGHNNGNGNGNGKPPEKLPEPVSVPTAQTPPSVEPPAPTAELDQAPPPEPAESQEP